METASCSVTAEPPRKWPVLVSRIESAGRPISAEDLWNAAVRAGVDPARLAWTLLTVLDCSQSHFATSPRMASPFWTMCTGRPF